MCYDKMYNSSSWNAIISCYWCALFEFVAAKDVSLIVQCWRQPRLEFSGFFLKVCLWRMGEIRARWLVDWEQSISADQTKHLKNTAAEAINVHEKTGHGLATPVFWTWNVCSRRSEKYLAEGRSLRKERMFTNFNTFFFHFTSPLWYE